MAVFGHFAVVSAALFNVLVVSSTTPVTCPTAALTYRAAVVEFQPIAETEYEQENLLINAHRAAEYVKEAGQLDVDIVVFPEYGLLSYTMMNSTREGFAKGSQDVPNPQNVQWNPCLEPGKFPTRRNQVLRVLSCAAKNHSVVVVASFLGREICTASSDPNCPQDGQYLYNTNVVFGKNGTLIARYRKYNLFYEDMLDHPAEPEYAIIDLGFAKFGMFICWDIFYKTPAVELVNKYGVRNLIFSTAWGSELPFITSTQNFAQFAHGVGANLLVSNLHLEEDNIVKHLGSGIYSSSRGALNETWDMATPGKMIVADVPVNPLVPAEEWIMCSDTSLIDGVDTIVKPESCIDPVLEPTGKATMTYTDLPSSDRTINKTLRVFNEPLTHNNYSYLELAGDQGQLSLCQGKLCCNVSYEFTNRDADDRYVLAILNGCRIIGKYNIALQICSILRCANRSEDGIQSCGKVPESQPTSRFKKLHISGLFQTKYIYPNIFSTTFSNVPRDLWQFNKQFCQADSSTIHKAKAYLEATSLDDYPVLVVSLYGRMYEWD